MAVGLIRGRLKFVGASVVRSQREETLGDLIHRIVVVVTTHHVPKVFGSRLDIAIGLFNSGDPDSPGFAPSVQG
jgi:hypothetical protein